MSENRTFLPYGRQWIGDDDVAAVAAVLHSDFLTTGPTVGAFEAGLRERVGAAGIVACSSGTAALHLAYLALDIGPGDVVIVPAITFMATANAAALAGADVVFADVDADTGLLTIESLGRAMTRAETIGRVRAVAPVHLNGLCAPMAEIGDFAREHGLLVVEDACHALGSTIEENGIDVPVGACSHSDAAVFSFHPVKTIAMGEGGAVAMRDVGRLELVRRLSSHGITRDAMTFERLDLARAADDGVNPWYHEMQNLGLNYRASDIHCALGLSQLGKFDDFAARRRALVARYRDALAPLAPHVRPVPAAPKQDPVWHLMPVLIDFDAAGTDRKTVMDRLRHEGIGTQVHYIPVPWQPYWAARVQTPELPGAKRYYERVLSLPLFAQMESADVDRVVSSLTRAVTKA